MKHIKNGWLILFLIFLNGCDAYPYRLLEFLHLWQPPAAKPLAPGKANVEMISEMLRVVMNSEPSQTEVASLADAANQGASLEGIYNGLAHSSNYRRSEFAHPGCSRAALDFFSDSLVWVEKQLTTPAHLTASSAHPIALAVDLAQPPAEVAFEAPLAISVDAYDQAFSSASIFTLKRVLSDEFLRLIDQKKSQPDFDHWYGEWVSRMSSLKIDFGLPLRNSGEVKFHEKWAQSATQDQLKWEVLNRIHRVLNVYGENK